MRRLSDLIDARAFDADGRRIGEVEDVRLVQDGPMIEGFGHKLRVDGVMIGRRARGLRLGFGRADVRGPWLLKALFQRLERQGQYYAWEDVEWEAATVRLRPGATPSTPPA
jgi:hypothetical protein